MKTVVSLINFVAGILLLLVGLGNFLFLAHSPSSAAAGVAAIAVGATCLWLATASIFGSENY